MININHRWNWQKPKRTDSMCTSRSTPPPKKTKKHADSESQRFIQLNYVIKAIWGTKTSPKQSVQMQTAARCRRASSRSRFHKSRRGSELRAGGAARRGGNHRQRWDNDFLKKGAHFNAHLCPRFAHCSDSSLTVSTATYSFFPAASSLTKQLLVACR